MIEACVWARHAECSTSLGTIGGRSPRALGLAGMGYRKHKHRRFRRQHWQRARDDRAEMIEAVAELVGKMIAAPGRLLARALAWISHPAETVQRVAESPQPQHSSYASRTRPRGTRRGATSRRAVAARIADRAIAGSLGALPYLRSSGLLTQGERALWLPLLHAVQGKYRIFCKVRLADVVCCPPDRADEPQWFEKISRFHVDFVLCDPRTTVPLLVVELDDCRHLEAARKERDDFKDAVLRAAGVPVYRVPARRDYDPIELAREIEPRINGGST